MVKVALSINGNSKSAVQLEPNIIYRIGRRLGLEFHSDDESIELAHATIALLAGGIVSLSAVAGKVFVNGQETGNEVKRICETDAVNGSLDLKFGNVPAKLDFNVAEPLDNEAAYDTSGFEDGNRCKSANTTSDSLIIPETEPQSADTSNNMESFTIPETQAVIFNRPSMFNEVSRVSLGDDFLIPETQDVLLNINDPVLVQQDQDQHTATSDDGESELGTQIRICTQDFNEYNEDAIDDFDSSLLLGDGGLAVFPPPPSLTEDNAGSDLDMSVLNWSASNSKCTALNSTRSVDISSRCEICLTPDLSLAGHRSDDLEVPCTQDIFDLLDAEPNKLTSASNVPAVVIFGTSNDADTSQVCNANPLTVASLETPESTPLQQEDNSQDFIEAQAFPLDAETNNDTSESNKPAAVHFATSNHDDTSHLCIAKPVIAASLETPEVTLQQADNSQDFIEAQAFPLDAEPINGTPESNVPDVVLFATSNHDDTSQACIAKPVTVASLETPEVTLQHEDNSQDFIETQAFPLRNAISALPKSVEHEFIDNATHLDVSNAEDFIETQPFIRPRKTTPKPNESIVTRLSITAQIHNNNEDFIETQPFPIKTITPKPIEPQSKLHNNNEDFIETDAFPTKTPPTVASPKPNPIETPDNLEDFIATQPFIRPPKKSLPKPNKLADVNLNITAEVHDNTDDTRETQLLIPSSENSDKASDNEKDDDCLQFSGDLSMRDNFDEELKQLIALSPLDNAPSDDEKQPKFVFDKEKTPEIKISQSMRLPTKSNTTDAGQQEVARSSGIKRSAPRSASPETKQIQISKPNSSIASKSKRTQNLPELHTSSTIAVPEIKSPGISARTRKKRSLVCNVEPTEPPKKKSAKTPQSTAESISDAKPKRGKTVVQKEPSERPKRGRPRKNGTATPQSTIPLEEPNTASMHQSEESVKEVKGKEQQSSNEKKSVSRSTKRQARNDDATIEENINESPKQLVVKIQRLTEFPRTISELNSMPKLSKANRTAELAKQISKEDANANSKNEACVANSSQESLASGIEEKPTTSSNARKLVTRGKKLPCRDPLKYINDYIKKIKSSGRKIIIALTMCNNTELQPVLSALRCNIEVSNDPQAFDLLIMDKGERTYKFLMAIASNKPILSSRWLCAMRETRSIIVKPDHVFNDSKFENIFKFKPIAVLENRSVLVGLDFILGSDIQPSAKEMKAIIQCAGGKVYSKPPPIASNVRLYAVASKNDRNILQQLRNYKNSQYIKTEGVMQALVQNKPELLDEHKITY